MIANIIDKRIRRYRWKSVHVIAEAIWHDNSVADADQAEWSTPEIDYVELEDMPLADAITWAHQQVGVVILYIYDGAIGQVPQRTDLP